MTKSMDEILKKIYAKYSTQSWYALGSAIIVGIITHLFILTNELFNHDDIGSFFEIGGARTLRWLQQLTEDLVSPWGAPVMAGGLTILLIAVSALLLTDTLQITSKSMAVLIGAFMVSTPVVACFMSYVEGSYMFVIGLPFAILACRWYEYGVKGFIGAMLCVMLAIAGYQSLLAVTIACIYIQLFCRLLKDEGTLKSWFVSLGKALGLLLLGLLCYIVSTRIFATINADSISTLQMGVTTSDLTASGYEAQAETGTLYVSNIVESVLISIKYFIKYHFNIFFEGANVSLASRYCVLANLVVLLCVGIVVCHAILKANGWIKKLLIIAVFAVAPICLNSTEILLNGKAHETLQMMYSIALTAVWVICVAEKGNRLTVRWKNIVTNIMFLMLLVHLYYNVQITNDAYMRMNSQYEAAYSEMTRIIDRVEQLPEWQAGNRKLYFDFKDGGGYLINDNYQSFTRMDDYIDMGWLGIMGTGVYRFWGNNNVSKYVVAYFGLEFETPTEEEVEEIKNTAEYAELEMFPSMDSIKVINNVVVVRMDDSMAGE